MRKRWVLAAVLTVVWAGAAGAVDVAFHGDLNNRFGLYSNHSEFYSGSHLEEGVANIQVIGDEETNTTWGDFKYRLWTEVGSDEGAVRGVYAIEIGAVHYGRGGSGKSQGGGFSGDSVNIETRWAYTDFQLPGVSSKARVKLGLQPFTVNHYVWQETAAGVLVDGAVGGAVDYRLAWMRGNELFNNRPGENLESLDGFLARADLVSVPGLGAGGFVLYQHENAGSGPGPGAIDAGKYGLKQFGEVDVDLYTLGLDGSYRMDAGFGKPFVNWDLMYQVGRIDHATFTGMDGTASGGFDVSAWFAHADLGLDLNRVRLTYTTWYASGDNDATDGDFNAYLATDVDITDSIILFEGGYTDDNYPTERPYLLDKGFFMNKIGADFKAADKVTLGGALLYMMTAEDLKYTDDNGRSQSEKALGTEIDAYVSYKPYPSLELAWNAGYLISADGMDAFEVKRDGKADQNLFLTTARARYKF